MTRREIKRWQKSIKEEVEKWMSACVCMCVQSQAWFIAKGWEAGYHWCSISLLYLNLLSPPPQCNTAAHTFLSLFSWWPSIDTMHSPACDLTRTLTIPVTSEYLNLTLYPNLYLNLILTVTLKPCLNPQIWSLWSHEVVMGWCAVSICKMSTLQINKWSYRKINKNKNE